MDRLQVNLVVYNDHIEIRCQIHMEPEKYINVILDLEIPPLHKRCRRNSPSKS
jgi:hypothetical protein